MSKLLLLLLLLTISHLKQNIPTVSGHQVFRVDNAIRPLISLCHVLLLPVPEAKNRGGEVLNRGGEVPREAVQAVVVPHSRLQAKGIRQSAPT